MKFNILKKFSFVLFFTLIISGCVGTVKTTDPVLTKAETADNSSVQTFLGINSAKAVSDTNVEVYFAPIAADTDNFAYVIHYGGQLSETFIPASSQKPDFRGLIRFTVTGLQANTRYDFSVQARNITTGIQSTNRASVAAITFSNATAKFAGITQLRNLPGANGLTSLEVFWNEAISRGGLVTKDEIDPIEYRITVIDGTLLNPGNMNDTSFTDPARKVFSIAANKRSAVVNGLISGTKYFVQVRAIHFGFSANSSNTGHKVEENNAYLEASTFTDDIANLVFDSTSFVTSFPPGAEGLTSLIGNWLPPKGNFDHYRVYYAINGVADVLNFLNTSAVNPFCFGPELNNLAITCEFVPFNALTNIITGLNPNTKYDLILAVCLTSDCIKAKRAISNLRSHTTTPGAVSFLGISTIDAAKNITELDRLFLNFSAPNFSTGNIDGLIVEYFGSDPTNLAPVQLNNPSSPNTSDLTVEPFDFLNDTTISISGIDPSAITAYCFLVYPFTFKSDGTKNLFKAGLNPRCKVAAITGPSLSAFPGISSKNCINPANGRKDVILNWVKPAVGVFNEYEIFYTQDSVFSFATAIDPLLNSNYSKIVVNSDQTQQQITDLNPNSTFKFGMLTRYLSVNGAVRSEFNTNISTCIFTN